jgi:hypothetical protein
MVKNKIKKIRISGDIVISIKDNKKSNKKNTKKRKRR